MARSGDFVRFTTSNGIKVCVEETGKYKTSLIALFVRTELSEDATLVALIPPLIKRGSERYPDMTEIERKQELLYGAHLSCDVAKIGENHLIDARLSVPNDRFIQGASGLLSDGIEFLAEVLLHPALEDGGFRGDYLAQEKENLRHFIEGLINDKIAYAGEMLIRHMCKGERYAIYEYGRVEDLPGVTGPDLLRFWRETLSRSPMEIYVSGEVKAKEVFRLLDRAFDFKRGPEVPTGPAASLVTPAEVREIREEQEIQQGKLCIGYRTFTTMADPDYFAAVWMNGILGAFPHSKLFKNVREKHSMAYYAGSSLDKMKGLLVISSGIEAGNYGKAVSCINDQVKAMQDGDVSDEEMSNTRAALINAFRSMEDSPGHKIQYQMQQQLAGRSESLKETIEKMSAVTRQEVVEVSRKLLADTIFFLAPRAAVD